MPDRLGRHGLILHFKLDGVIKMMNQWKRVSRKLAVVLMTLSLVGVAAAVNPTSSYAIPSAGTYVFTSGLTGTFTSNGTSLTAWDILGPSGTDYLTGGTILNDSNTFTQIVGTHGLGISWLLNGFGEGSLNPLGGTLTHVTYQRSVAEASTIILFLLSFVGLTVFSCWRRQGGVQVG